MSAIDGADRTVSDDDGQAGQRAAARRTALTIGVIAVSIYVAFILSGVIGR